LYLYLYYYGTTSDAAPRLSALHRDCFRGRNPRRVRAPKEQAAAADDVAAVATQRVPRRRARRV
jgi:hypothetical protein